MKKLFLSILFSLLCFTTGCELEGYTEIQYVNTKFYTRVYNNKEVECKVYHNGEVEHLFTLNAANNYTTVKKLVEDEKYTVTTAIDGVIQSTRTFVANCDNALITFTIVVNTDVEIIEDEVVFDFS